MDRIPKRPSVASIIKNNKEFFSNFNKQLSNVGFALFSHKEYSFLELVVVAGRGMVGVEFRTRKPETTYYFTINIIDYEEIILKGNSLPGNKWFCWTDLELEAYFKLFLGYYNDKYKIRLISLDAFMELYSEIENKEVALRTLGAPLITGDCFRILNNQRPYFSEYTSNNIAKWFGENYKKYGFSP